jgi:serine/threonine protein kinase
MFRLIKRILGLAGDDTDHGTGDREAAEARRRAQAAAQRQAEAAAQRQAEAAAQRQADQERERRLDQKIESAMESLNQQNLMIKLDKIDLDKEIGRGAFGVVYEVKFKGTVCVAKIIHALLHDEEYETINHSPFEYKSAQYNFITECNLLSSLKHPNIVQFLGVCKLRTQYGILALVMEKLALNLDVFILQHNEFRNKMEMNISILRDISAGLQYIHSQNLIHCDLSAQNVLLTPFFKAKIAGFGLCIQTNKEHLIGSINYKLVSPQETNHVPPNHVPPEAINKKKVTQKLDSFSFGHLMLCLLINEYPTRKNDNANLTEIEKRREWLNKLHAILDGSNYFYLYRFTKKCLMNDPDERPTAMIIHQTMTGLYSPDEEIAAVSLTTVTVLLICCINH